MESITNSNDYESIARAICNQTNNANPEKFNLDMVLQVIDKIEMFTGCKLYNKDQLTNQLVELTEEDFTTGAKQAIWKNLIPQVDFNTVFKSNMEFTLVFNQDDVVVLYKNKPVSSNSLEQIKQDLISNNFNFPPITELYVDNICQVISKFINKDISVQYYCANIPLPYWKLFEIKCKKSNGGISQEIRTKCDELEKIVTGQYFKSVKPNVQVTGQAPSADDDELKAVLMQIEEYESKGKSSSSSSSNVSNFANLTDNEKKALDDIYRMEVMSYLNDNEIMQFLDAIEKIDAFDKESKFNDKQFITTYFKLLIDSTGAIGNKIAKFYYVYKVYCLINNASAFIEQHETMRTAVANKINEFTEELYILQSAELKLYNGVVSTMEKTKELIDTIGKKANPNYVPTWKTDNQQIILNQIITNANANTNPNNYNNNKIIIEDSDDEIENEDHNDDESMGSDYDTDN